MSEEAAAMFAPDDAPYVFACTQCKTTQWKYQDCNTTRAVRRGVAQCGNCDSEITMLRDNQEGDQ